MFVIVEMSLCVKLIFVAIILSDVRHRERERERELNLLSTFRTFCLLI